MQNTLSGQRQFKMYIKIHEAGEGRLIIAMCDKELVGKTLKNGDVEVEIKESFYKGEELEEEKIKELIKQPVILNIFGEKSIKLAMDCDLLKEENILDIEGVPHAQVA